MRTPPRKRPAPGRQRQEPPTPAIEVLGRDTYLAMIEGAVGANMFRHLWATVGGARADITQNGVLSCAFFCSVILRHFDLIKEPHATVLGLVADLKKRGWKKAAAPRHRGEIIVWAPVKGDPERPRHIGFFIGEGMAVSNSSLTRMPARHPINWDTPPRALEAIYTHPFLTRR